MAAGRPTIWLLLAAPGLAAIAVGAMNRTRAATPDPPPAEPAPVAPTIATPPATVHESDERRDDAPKCLAAGHDDDVSSETYEDGAADRITGRLLDARGSPAPADTRLRFWSPDAARNVELDENGAFELTNTDGTEYDVDAILSDVDWPGGGAPRLHVGRLHAGDLDVVLKLSVAQEVLVAGTLVDDAGGPLGGWTVLGEARDSALDSTCRSRAQTDATGRFRLVGWKRKTLSLHASSPDSRDRTILREERDAATGEIRAVVAPPGVAGRVLVPDGASPDGAVVRLRRVAGGAERTFVVGRDGVFHFEPADISSLFELAVECGASAVVPQFTCSGDDHEIPLRCMPPENCLEGRAFDATGAPLRRSWLRFVAAGPGNDVQTMTDNEGAFRTTDARGGNFDVFLLAPGDDGRLVPGPRLGRVKGGDRNLRLHAAR